MKNLRCSDLNLLEPGATPAAQTRLPKGRCAGRRPIWSAPAPATARCSGY